MPITPTEKVWMDGKLVPWADASIHVLTHSLHYGGGVFDEARACDLSSERPHRTLVPVGEDFHDRHSVLARRVDGCL